MDWTKMNSKMNFPNEKSNLIKKFLSQDSRKTRLVVALSAFSLFLFLVVALTFPFKDRLLNLLYPKPKVKATTCDNQEPFPTIKAGFVYSGGDLDQAIKKLNTSLYYTYDTNLGPQKRIYLIGKYARNYIDPSGIRLLMGDNLSNSDFKGLQGQMPAGWNFVSEGKGGSARVETDPENVLNGNTSGEISNTKNSSGSQLSQVFKRNVTPSQVVIFGTWVKAKDPSLVKIFLQNAQPPHQEFGTMSGASEPGQWTYALGYGKVPPGVTNLQIVLKVSGENTAWFAGTVAAVISPEPSPALTKLVLERCGAAWLIDDEPGWDATYRALVMKSLSPEVYALIYHQFYTLIKAIDSEAIVVPGNLAGAPTTFEGVAGYSPKLFLDKWRASYKDFFGAEPPLDAMGIHYLATEASRWDGAEDLANYMTKLRSYLEQVPEWRSKPIWITKLGVARSAPNGGVDFVKEAIKFLTVNRLKIEKWFWFDTCGNNPNLASLFESSNKICTWPMALTTVGSAYLVQNFPPIPSPTLAPTPTLTPVPTLAPSPTLTLTPAPSPTSAPPATPSATLAPTIESTPTATITPAT